MSSGPFTVARDGVRVALKVIPRSPKTTLDGVRDGRLLVRVTAPPVDAAANDAVTEFLARSLGVPRRAVTLVMGETSRLKTVAVAGLPLDEVRVRLTPGTPERPPTRP